MSESFFVGLDLTSFADNGKKKPISRVTLQKDNNTAFTAGDDTGLELSATCYYATQAMADTLLDKVKGIVYNAYKAENAKLDPAAELGDGITSGGVYSVIAKVDDDGYGYPNVTAPGEKEVEDEFPYTTLETKITGQLASTDATISKITVNLAGISLEVSKKIGEEQAKTLIQQSLNSIELSVVNSGMSSTITMTADGIEAKTAKIEITGAVTFYDLSHKGSTTINGSNITTGEIDAVDIRGVNIYGATYYDAGEATKLTLIGGSVTQGFQIYDETNRVEMFSVLKETLGDTVDRSSTIYLDGVAFATQESGKIYLSQDVTGIDTTAVFG